MEFYRIWLILCLVVFLQLVRTHGFCNDDEVQCMNGTCVPRNSSNCQNGTDNDLVNIGSPCKQDVECQSMINGTVCVNNTCTCDKTYNEVNGTCVEIEFRIDTRSCLSDVDCDSIMINTTCINNTCVCVQGYIEDSGTCLLNDTSRTQEDLNYAHNATRAEGNGTCMGDIDCGLVMDDSICVNNTCICTHGFTQVNESCQRIKRKIFEACSSDDDCLEFINNSTCVFGLCTCVIGKRPTLSRDQCVPNMIGDKCFSDKDCFTVIDNSVCIDLSCSCAIGFQSVLNSSCEARKLNDPCQENDDCSTVMNNSYCSINETCECEMGYLVDGHGTECRLPSVGDACEIDEDCQVGVVDAECVNITCTCKTGFHFVDSIDQCIPRQIYHNCGVDLDCSTSVNNSECVNSTCLCTIGYRSTEDNDACVSRKISNTCDTHKDCDSAVINSTCYNNTCVCRSGFKTGEYNDTCEIRRVGDMCDIDTDCADSVHNSYCSLEVCACLDGFKVSHDDNTTCNRRLVGDSCNTEEDCLFAMNYTMCINNTCLCEQGYSSINNDTSCKLNVIGDICQEDVDCMVAVNDSVCKKNVCKCSVGYNVNDDGSECTRRKIYDETCKYDSDCRFAVKFSECKRGQCICNVGYHATADNDTCVPFKIGDSGCSSSPSWNDCRIQIPNSSCKDGTCVCDIGRMPVNNDTVCQKRRVGDPCDVDKDCSWAISRSECSNLTCTCVEGYEKFPPNNTKCVFSPKQILDTCTFDQQCRNIHGHSECRNDFGIHQCVCEEGYHIREGNLTYCYAPMALGNYCRYQGWCEYFMGENLACNDDSCVCRDGYLENDTFNGCIHYPVAVGDYCRETEHCTVNIPHAVCEETKQCQCHYKYKPSADGTRCLQREFVEVPAEVDVQFGDQCKSVDNCPRKNRAYMKCDQELGRFSDRCMCVPGYTSRFDSTTYFCEEAQTYFFYVNISQEIGCDTKTDADDSARCYIYQPIRLLRQYNNPITGAKYRGIRERIIHHGFGSLFRNSSHPKIQARFLNAELVNMTKTNEGIQIGILLYFLADYYDIINQTDVADEIVAGLFSSDGELGRSQLKLTEPYEDQLEWRDFDECVEQNELYQDCAFNTSWCLNTRVSYMCCCQIGFEDRSPKPLVRPGRVCKVPKNNDKHSLSCSNGTCETKWEYIALALVAFGLLLVFFIGYEIYARKKKLEKSDIYFKLRKAARKAKLRALRERRKTMKRKKKEEQTDNDTDKLVETV